MHRDSSQREVAESAVYTHKQWLLRHVQRQDTLRGIKGSVEHIVGTQLAKALMSCRLLLPHNRGLPRACILSGGASKLQYLAAFRMEDAYGRAGRESR